MWCVRGRSRLNRSAAVRTASGFLWLLLMPLSKAAQNLTLADATTFIAVSSYDRSNHTIRVTGGFRGMTAITWHEDSDEPCKLVLDTKHLNRQDINEPQAGG